MSRNKIALLQLMSLKKAPLYRRGLIQAAVTFDVITHDEWYELKKQIDRKVKNPHL